MNAPIQLKEVIWEITNRCNKNCAYCGSKHFIEPCIGADINIQENKTQRAILEQLKLFPPKHLTISGGEPGVMNLEFLAKVVDELSLKGVRVSFISNGLILFKMLAALNPESMSSSADRSAVNVLLEKTASFGISINTPDDLKYYSRFKGSPFCPKKHPPIVFVTNFGKHNFWDYDAIADAAAEFREVEGWQVQLTCGNDLQLPPDAILQLWDKIELSEKKFKEIKGGGPKIYISDNLLEEPEDSKVRICTAGLTSCSITYDGKVVPCIALRCMENKNIKSVNFAMCGEAQTLERDSLEYIWKTQFKDIRYGNEYCKFECCRELCFKYPKRPTKVKVDIDPGTGIYNPKRVVTIPPMNPSPIRPWDGGGAISIYSAVDPLIGRGFETVSLYGVVAPRSNIEPILDHENLIPKISDFDKFSWTGSTNSKYEPTKKPDNSDNRD